MQCITLAYLNRTRIFVGGSEDVPFNPKSSKPITAKSNENIDKIRNLAGIYHRLMIGMLNVNKKAIRKMFSKI
jgi:hypothetical protein